MEVIQIKNELNASEFNFLFKNIKFGQQLSHFLHALFCEQLLFSLTLLMYQKLSG